MKVRALFGKIFILKFFYFKLRFLKNDLILLILGDINSKFEITIAWVHISIYSEVSVSVSVSAETKIFFRFMYRFRPKRKMAVSVSFGFGRNEKKPFGRTLTNTLGGWVSPAYLLACQAYNKKRVILGLVQLKLRILYQK